MKVLDYAGAGLKAVKGAATAVAKAVSGPAVPRLTHVCDGFHCDCERRAEIAAQSRESAGAWLSGRTGWLKRER